MEKNITKKIYTVYGEGYLNDRTCQKWLTKFHAGDLPQMSRRRKIDSDYVTRK